MSLTCGIEDTTVYYFFTSCAQAIAATTSLSGAMLIFRYQSLYELVADGATGVATEFKKSNLVRYVPWEGEDQANFTKFTTFIGKTNVLRKYFVQQPDLRRKQFTQKFEAAKVEVPGHLATFESMRNLFAQYEARVKTATRLRRLTIAVTLVGLSLVLFGLLFTLSPSYFANYPIVCDGWRAYGATLCLYLGFAVYVTSVAFTNPLKER